MSTIFKKHRLLILSILAYLAGLGLAAFIWFGPGPTSARTIKAPSVQPLDDWVLCEDLGVGYVPGVPDIRQRFRLCHPGGWEFLVYCLDPGLPTPQLGATCTEIDPGLFDCGGFTQRLRLYEVAATPPPRPTRTVTSTPTPTVTPTPTRRVSTPHPPTGITPAVCDPPESCAAAVERPHPGGQGNLLWLGLLALSLTGLILVQGGMMVMRGRRK